MVKRFNCHTCLWVELFCYFQPPNAYSCGPIWKLPIFLSAEQNFWNTDKFLKIAFPLPVFKKIISWFFCQHYHFHRRKGFCNKNEVLLEVRWWLFFSFLCFRYLKAISVLADVKSLVFYLKNHFPFFHYRKVFFLYYDLFTL